MKKSLLGIIGVVFIFYLTGCGKNIFSGIITIVAALLVGATGVAIRGGVAGSATAN